MVMGALLCVVIALGALSQVVRDGAFVDHAVMAASHNVQDSLGGATDVFCY